MSIKITEIANLKHIFKSILDITDVISLAVENNELIIKGIDKNLTVLEIITFREVYVMDKHFIEQNYYVHELLAEVNKSCNSIEFKYASLDSSTGNLNITIDDDTTSVINPVNTSTFFINKCALTTIKQLKIKSAQKMFLSWECSKKILKYKGDLFWIKYNNTCVNFYTCIDSDVYRYNKNVDIKYDCDSQCHTICVELSSFKKIVKAFSSDISLYINRDAPIILTAQNDSFGVIFGLACLNNFF